MKKQNTEQTIIDQDSETTATARAVALCGDDRLVRELRPLLEANGFTVLAADDAQAVAAAGNGLAAGIEVSSSGWDAKKEGLLLLEAHLPASTLIVSSSVTVTAAQQSAWMAHPERLIGWCAFPTLMEGPLAETAIPLHTKQSVVKAAQEFFGALGKEIVVVQDRVGMILPGVLAQIINEALSTVQQNVASAEDIDAAMKTGAGYPLGPIEWGEKIGFAAVAALLDAMRAETGEERFKVATLLRQLALSGKFWKEKIATPEPVQEVLQLDDVASAPSASPKQKKKRGKKSQQQTDPPAPADAPAVEVTEIEVTAVEAAEDVAPDEAQGNEEDINVILSEAKNLESDQL